ncbi:hypothetical protein [Gemella haemolysans]|jgi:hypothetical protein|uniref:Uncharacterized protein n=2 Tax=Gemella haemolysans TaxID=1379 RepID=A0AA87B717_9BACL|nr:hypothetical protein [Gemella haemolysans]EGF86553.1 hypothetical protein HMPREF0428_00463 [Gemella haemolysans M341]QIX87698.1 hypothetical protein FOC48_02530 [Gemella haemolysans]
MSSLYIPLIFLLVSFIIDKVRENNKTKKEPIKKVKKSKTKVKNTMSKAQQQKESPVINQQTLTRKSFEKKQRVIVDREKEIFSNSLTFNKEKVVNDIIFSEILSKPKSKR